ncbi:MAG: flagellar basal body-associated FliL family protein [Aestuariivirga sp.]|uniref:flagellar basal body-associated FliL family protein n=1 Tax=Aestuariivirga sp. TaxID=2650926 RepID=UPI00301B2FEA
MASSGSTDKGGMITTIVSILLLSLVGAGVGFSVGIFLQPTTGAESKPAASSASTKAMPPNSDVIEHPNETSSTAESLPDIEDDAEELEADLKIITIPPILTTLASPEGKWIRLEGSILAKPSAEKSPELLAERSGEQILAYLRTVRLEQLQGPSGLIALRDDLNETVRSLSNGDVRGVLIHGLLVE